MTLDIAKEAFVILQLERGMYTSLKEDASAAPCKQLFYLSADFFVREQIAFRAGRLAVKRAEATVDDTHIRVVDVAIDEIGHDAVWMAPLANLIRGGKEFSIARFFKKA
jgi:hypothetical protein